MTVDWAADLFLSLTAVYDSVIAPSFKVAASALSERVNFLKKLALFDGWPLRELFMIANWMTVETHPVVSTVIALMRIIARKRQ